MTMSPWTGSATRSTMYSMISSLQLQPALLLRHVSPLCASLFTLTYPVYRTHVALFVLLWSYVTLHCLHNVAACTLATLYLSARCTSAHWLSVSSQPVSSPGVVPALPHKHVPLPQRMFSLPPLISLNALPAFCMPGLWLSAVSLPNQSLTFCWFKLCQAAESRSL